jgi:uncharacterized protein YacL (UPF0231 family)
MDYKFFREVSGKPSAETEDEVSTFGDWLSNELGDNSSAVKALLAVIEQLQTDQLKSHKQKGHNHTLVLNQEEAELHSHLGYYDEDEGLPEGTQLDQQDAMGCGLEDLKELILAWLEFIEG